MNRKSIGIDLDTTLNNLNEVWLKRYNKDYHDNLTPDDLLTWNIDEYVKPECNKKIFDYLYESNFFKNLGIQPLAKEVTNILSEKYDLYIVTAYTANVCMDKTEWIKKNLPSIPVHNIIFCNDKSKILMDYLIDDGGHNLEVFSGTPIIFNQKYNEYLKDRYYRVYNWMDILNYFVRKDKEKI